MRLTRPLLALLSLALLAAAVATALPPSAAAGWLSRIAGGAAEVGVGGAGRAARIGATALERAAAHVKALPATAKGTALAVHVTPEGHWQFMNEAGETFTAGTPQELARAIPTLTGEAAGGGKLALYLSDSTVFEQRALLKDLPKADSLHVVVGDAAFPLKRRGSGAAETLYAEVRPNIVVELDRQALFEEATWQLGRPLNRADIRVLALEAGAGERLASVPRFDPATKAAMVDRLDPGRLAGALGSVRGQTVLVTGRIEGETLHLAASGKPGSALSLKDLAAAADRHDVNLVVLEAETPRQPGGRNWLWQRVEVKGLDEAMRRATFADFLDSLAASRGELVVTATAETAGRVLVRAVPTGSAAAPLSGSFTEWVGSLASSWSTDLAGHVTGHVAAAAVKAYMRDAARQRELDNRIIPWLPAWLQGLYLCSLLAGFIGHRFSFAWFARIWPAERRQDYAGRIGFRLAQAARLTVATLLFLPVVGLPAMLASMAVGLWETVTAPFRWLRRLKDKAA